MTIQNASDYAYSSGLEEMTANDITVPRLQIVHREGKFKDSLSGQVFDQIDVIILGLVKQRSLWHTTVDDNDRPMCRSTDFEFGTPNETEKQPANKRFPWALSGFNPTDYPADTDGLRKLPCASCPLKDWGSHPDGNKPYCSEQWALPVLYNSTPEDGEGAENWVPAILTLQKSSLKPLKSYLSAFQRTKQPAFTAVTTIKLQVNTRGQTDYSIPTFIRGSRTDKSYWPEYGANFDSMRNFLRNGRQAFDDVNDEAGQSNVPQQPVREDPWAAAPATQAPAQPQQQTPVHAEVVQDPPVQQQAPAPEQPAAQQTPPPAQPQQPAQQNAPANLTDDLPF